MMVPVTKAHLKRINSMVMVYSHGQNQIGKNMKDSGKMVRCMDMAHLLGKMVISMKVSIVMIKDREEVH